MPRFVTPVALLAFTLLAPPVRAAEPWFPGPKPTKVPTQFFKDPAGRPAAGKAYVCWDKAPVLADPGRPDPAAPKTELLADRFDIGGEHRTAAGVDYWLLVKRAEPASTINLDIQEDGYVGWVRKDQCLAFAGDRPFALPDPATDIYRKCMLINTLENARQAETLRELVSFYAHPGPPDPKTDRPPRVRPLFQIYYVFAETPTHFFLGTKAEPTADDAPRECLLGWVPRARVCPWNTREAVEFRKAPGRRQPARVFGRYDDLVKYLRDRPPRTAVDAGTYQPQPLASEDLKGKELQFFQTRFPLVSDDEARVNGSGEEAPGLGGFRLYRVGVIGDVYDRNLRRQFTARQSEMLRYELGELKKQVGTIQVMFVIDATRGMDDWFKTGKQTVRKIIDAVQALGDAGAVKPTVEFSVNFYRDRDGTSLKVFENHPFSRDVTEVLDLFDKAQALGGGPPLDLVFEGLCRALAGGAPEKRATVFTPNAVKILVLIGDDGNNPDDKEYPLDKVVEQLAAAGGPSPVGFFAVSVGDQTRPQYKAFTDQTREIARRLAAREMALREDRLKGAKDREEFEAAVRDLVGRPLVSTDPGAVTRAIEKRFKLAVAEMRFKRDQLAKLEESGTAADNPLVQLDEKHPLAASYGVVWEEQVLADIRKKDLGALLTARDGIQLFQKGWVADNDPSEDRDENDRPVMQLRNMILIERGELARLRDFLAHVTGTEWSPKTMADTWKRSLDQLTSGDLKLRAGASDSPVAVMRKMCRGIQIRQGLMALPFDKLATLGADQIKQAHDQLKGCLRRIDNALNEREGKVWWGDEVSDKGLDRRAWLPRDILP